MMVNIIISGIIFGYAGFAFVKFLKKSKQGKCAACSMKDSCNSNSSSVVKDKAKSD